MVSLGSRRRPQVRNTFIDMCLCCITMPVITVRVDEQLKRKMDDLKEVNWSEVTRAAIEEKVRETEMWRHVDVPRLKRASAETDELRRRVEGWSSTSEIRRWRSCVSDSS